MNAAFRNCCRSVPGAGRVRNDQNYWQRVDEYLSEQGAIRFSHGICPSCLAEVQSQLDTDIS